MAEGTDEGGDVEQIARIMSELADTLNAGGVRLKLRGGREIVGPVLGFSAKRKDKKGDVTWSGTVRIQIDTGELDVDCDTIESVVE